MSTAGHHAAGPPAAALPAAGSLVVLLEVVLVVQQDLPAAAGLHYLQELQAAVAAAGQGPAEIINNISFSYDTK